MTWKKHKIRSRWIDQNGRHIMLTKHLDHRVCFDCRVSFRCTWVCPSCRKPTTWVGQNFKPPRREAIKQWEKCRAIVAKTWNYFHLEDMGPKQKYKYLNEVNPKSNRKRRHS